MTSFTPRQPARDDERGSMSMYAAVLAVGLMLLAGVVWDGSTRMRIALRASYVASEAGRAASQAIAAEAIAGQNADVDPARGAAAARAYLSSAGVEGTVAVSGQRVIITTTIPWDPTFVPVAGQAMTGHAVARTVRTE